MADQPAVTTPGGSDLFASLHSLDYDEAMAMLVDETSASSGRTPSFKTGLTPGGNNGAGNSGQDPFLMTPRTTEFMAELAAAVTPMPANANGDQAQNPAMLFDHDLVAGSGARALPTAAVREEGGDDDDDDGDALRPDDLLTPLSFSFTPTGASGGANGRYHVAAAHKHKRVRSNPDMLQSVNYQQLMGNNNNTITAAQSPLRPSVGDGHNGSASVPTTPLDSDASYSPLPATLPVNVITPIAFHPNDQNQSDDTFPSDMDSFLKDVQWSELGENNTNSMNVDTLSSLGAGQYHRSQRIQAGVNELKMKRKRPSQHARHHSNPVDLLHNLDQFRMLSQQQHQQQQQQLQQLQQQQQVPPLAQEQQQVLYTPPPSPPLPMPMQYPSPTKLGGMMAPMAQQQHMMMASPPNPFAMAPPSMPMQEMHFQVPVDIANGSARSLHARRSSMPATAFARGRGGPGHRRGASRGGSTGLSMDMSQMNLDFLSLPEDEFQQQLHQQRQQQQQQQQMYHPHAMMNGAFPSPPSSPPLQNFQQQLHSPEFMGGVGGMPVGDMENEKNRKSYKCGRCGKPKVGHVCTMPDLRNNWTQVDIDVTKGLKVVRTNVHIVATKNTWVPQHEDHL